MITITTTLNLNLSTVQLNSHFFEQNIWHPVGECPDQRRIREYLQDQYRSARRDRAMCHRELHRDTSREKFIRMMKLMKAITKALNSLDDTKIEYRKGWRCK